jgi:hypothetical protein
LKFREEIDHLKQSNLLKNKDLNYEVRIINSEDTYLVRHPVLRAGKPIESCIFDGDDIDTTIHLGIYLNRK